MTSNLYIIAEAAQGYEGNPEIAKLLVKAAAKSGADAIKFQVIYADDVAVPAYQYYDLFRQLEMPIEAWKDIRALAQELEIDFYADVSGPKSAELCGQLSLDGAKIHSTCFFEDPLFDWCYEHVGQTLISIGGIELTEVRAKLEKCSGQDIVVMHGFQAEPTPTEKNALNRISLLQNQLGVEIGFMDHADGEGPDGIHLSAMALALGVRIFEKHITLDRVLELEDHVSALTPERFREYRDTIQRLSLALQDSGIELSQEEQEYRFKALKRVVATRDIKQGELVNGDDIKLLRPKVLSGIYDPSEVIGRTAAADLVIGNPIDEEQLI